MVQNVVIFALIDLLNNDPSLVSDRMHIVCASWPLNKSLKLYLAVHCLCHYFIVPDWSIPSFLIGSINSLTILANLLLRQWQVDAGHRMIINDYLSNRRSLLEV